MQNYYAKKQNITQKKDAPSASSVIDASSQSESLQRKADMANSTAQRVETPRPNNTGMPDNLKAGIESLSGFSMDDVRVHYNSSKPATVQALAYTQGTDIHVAPGQEKHLPHEAWHVAQQMAGRVSPTTNINGMPVNDNAALEHEADVMGEKAVQCVKINTEIFSNLKKKDDAPNIAQLKKITEFTEKELDTVKYNAYKRCCSYLGVKEYGFAKVAGLEGKARTSVLNSGAALVLPKKIALMYVEFWNSYLLLGSGLEFDDVVDLENQLVQDFILHYESLDDLVGRVKHSYSDFSYDDIPKDDKKAPEETQKNKKTRKESSGNTLKGVSLSTIKTVPQKALTIYRTMKIGAMRSQLHPNADGVYEFFLFPAGTQGGHGGALGTALHYAPRHIVPGKKHKEAYEDYIIVQLTLFFDKGEWNGLQFLSDAEGLDAKSEKASMLPLSKARDATAKEYYQFSLSFSSSRQLKTLYKAKKNDSSTSCSVISANVISKNKYVLYDCEDRDRRCIWKSDAPIAEDGDVTKTEESAIDDEAKDFGVSEIDEKKLYPKIIIWQKVFDFVKRFRQPISLDSVKEKFFPKIETKEVETLLEESGLFKFYKNKELLTWIPIVLPFNPQKGGGSANPNLLIVGNERFVRQDCGSTNYNCLLLSLGICNSEAHKRIRKAVIRYEESLSWLIGETTMTNFLDAFTTLPVLRALGYLTASDVWIYSNRPPTPCWFHFDGTSFMQIPINSVQNFGDNPVFLYFNGYNHYEAMSKALV